MNPLTEKIWYTDDEDYDMRVIISTVTEHPSVWKITKCENVQPFGIQKLTIYNDMFNPHTDYVNLETGEMYADYFQSSIEPTDLLDTTLTPSSNTAKITASTATLKVGGSYKTLSVNVFDENGMDITDNYSDATFEWTCSVDEVEYTNNTDVITWLNGTAFNKKKIKFCNDRSYLEKILEVKCIVSKDDKTIDTVMQFGLIV